MEISLSMFHWWLHLYLKWSKHHTQTTWLSSAHPAGYSLIPNDISSHRLSEWSSVCNHLKLSEMLHHIFPINNPPYFLFTSYHYHMHTQLYLKYNLHFLYLICLFYSIYPELTHNKQFIRHNIPQNTVLIIPKSPLISTQTNYPQHKAPHRIVSS